MPPLVGFLGVLQVISLLAAAAVTQEDFRSPQVQVLTSEITSPPASAGAYRTMRYTSRSAGDAQAWQNALRSRLSSLLKIDDLPRGKEAIPLRPRGVSSEHRGSHVVKELEISSTADRRIRILVTMPTARRGPRPAVVCMGGHGSDLHSPYGAKTLSKELSKSRSDAIYRGFGTVLAEKGYVTVSATVSQHQVYENGRLLMGERVWDLIRCVDYLQSRPEVDPSRIGCAGLSLGGEMAMWLGALDERLAATVSSGFLTTMDHMEQNHCLCWKFEGLRELADFADIYSLIAPRPLQCQNGLLEPPSQFYVPLARQAMEEVRLIYRDLGRPENATLDVHDEGHVIDLPALVYFLDKHLHPER